MDKKTAVHVGAEVLVGGAAFTYLLNRIATLENRVAELEKDTQAVAKHQLKTEKNHAAHINKLMSNNSHQHRHHQPHIQSRPQQPHVHHKTSKTPRVVIEESEDEEDEDDKLLNDEYGEEEPEPVVIPPPKSSKKNVSFKPTPKMASKGGMEDVKKLAAEMAKRAGADY